MATTANEALRDALIRHQIYLLRYSGSLRNQLNDLLAKTEAKIAALIADRLGERKGLNTPGDVRRMRQLITAVDKLRKGGWTSATDELINQMVDLAKQEPVFAAGIFATTSLVVLDTLTLPPARQLKAIALETPFEGRLLKDWAASLATDDLRRINAAIQLGMVAGEGSAEITRRVIGTKALAGTDGVTEITRRQVGAIVRTAVQHVANSVRDEFMQDNADIIEAEQFVATLDSRTTPICRALDGKQFEVGKGPRPPLHIACRSLRVAAFDGERLGERPAKSSTRKQVLQEFTDKNGLASVEDRDDLPFGSKTKYDDFERKRVRELTGRVPASTSYQVWLKTQTNAFQDEIMGATKAKLFRDGGLTLDKYVTANGTELTLSQLAKKYSDSFKLAGLDPSVFR